MHNRVNFVLPCNATARQPAVSERDLDELQSEIGALPNVYLDFLRRWNELHFAETMAFPLADAQDEDEVGYVQRFHGVGDRDICQDLRAAGRAYNFQQRTPKYMRIIGGWMGIEHVCMSLDQSEFGKIYWWNPGEAWPDVEEVASMDYMRPVADDFWQFWNLLQREEDMQYEWLQ